MVKKLILDILSSGGIVLALFGLILIIFGIFFIPDAWDEVIKNMPARYGIAISGVAAIVIGFFLSAIGG